ncbi:hypothetical protein H6G11_15690 [Cyanobacterium aponinum FACHB-4101]|uniref:hypothetical protein n=1 Tax=Cyanobacterium aponinum TaxID=379064 RepID=UPI0016815E14|nr:hypothetical protein [Cyanobacterium aponinum]MBD2395687.1 hypothetical protein [Cyanobacterium aponinum FACHB-4101]
MGKVKLAKKATKATLKGSKYIWNPTNWVDLIWDAAVDTATDAAFGALEDAIAGEQEQPQLEVQNNYTYNTYVTNKTVTNPVIPQIFPPKYNYQQPPRIWRSPPQISLPDPILPTDIDNQTATQTPVGASINVGAAVQNNRYKMGKTIFHPASTQKKAIRRKVPKNFLALAYQNAQNEAIKAIDTLKNGQPAPIEYPSFVMFRDKIIEEKEKWNLGGLDDNGCSRAS